jgi:hypothetical protein
MSDGHIYQIRIRGHISENWASWFEGLTLRREESGDTIIRGALPDQAALHGILMIVRDLGLTLVEVKCLDCDCAS